MFGDETLAARQCPQYEHNSQATEGCWSSASWCVTPGADWWVATWSAPARFAPQCSIVCGPAPAMDAIPKAPLTGARISDKAISSLTVRWKTWGMGWA